MAGYYDRFLSKTRKEGTVETVQTALDSLGSSLPGRLEQIEAIRDDANKPNFKTCDVNRAIHKCDHDG